MSTTEWSPSTWRSKPVAQDVEYTNQDQLDKVLHKLGTLPPLVTPSEIERLRYQLGLVQHNEAFLLHAGDCAESFDACTHENISTKIGLILSFSLILVWGGRLPIVRIGRIAGQYAKPRSSKTEKVRDKEVLSFRGDNINGLDPDDRTPDPERLLRAYFHSTTTLNYIRGLLTSGFASLHHPRDWSLNHVRSPSLRREFENIVDSLSDALDFSRTIGADTSGLSYERGGGRGTLAEVDFYTSHEGLSLPYEEALTRKISIPSGIKSREHTKTFESQESKDSDTTTYYNTSAHFLWIGDRTRQLTGAHVEYFRGIRNPIGIKVGPSMSEEDREPKQRLGQNHPDHSLRRLKGKVLRGRLDFHFISFSIPFSSLFLSSTLHIARVSGYSPVFAYIPKYVSLPPSCYLCSLYHCIPTYASRTSLAIDGGAHRAFDVPQPHALIEEYLASHITAVRKSGHPVIWVCDPMHGNTLTSSGGLKTRNFGTIISELTACLRIHAENGSRLGGVSLEFTGELNDEGFSVTECLGGSMELSEEQLGLRYQVSMDMNKLVESGSENVEDRMDGGCLREADDHDEQMVRIIDIHQDVMRLPRRLFENQGGQPDGRCLRAD
ncbi:hypothetical protein D9758_009886 [Tetrapyrgos nigripes]|uniref:Phospho-2-dehydro-3-deoxyheptonate aldolase n=1 Tax=Tetrapyrgos nigripes TaxID=182062 RepID=A0A8H5LSG5_9AGAR|nr:hypothetical protein D9758_009886 [Tetrapyrgos nigripes]